MRHKYTPELRRRLERHPQDARPILEVLTVDAEDVIDTKAEWDAADGSPAVTSLDNGGIVLTGTVATLVDQTTVLAGADITTLVNPMSASIGCAVVEWAGNIEGKEIHSAVANLDPDTGAGKEVTTWVAQLFEVDSVQMVDAMGILSWGLRTLTRPVLVTASGSAGDVTFSFTNNGGAARLGGPPKATAAAITAGAPTTTTTVMMVWAYKEEGAAASNVAWLCDSGNSSVTVSTHTVSRRTLNRYEAHDAILNGTVYQDFGTAAGVPDFALKGKAYVAVTVTFTTDDIDLGASPGASTDLRVVVEGQSNGGTMLVELNDGSGWVTVYDGDVIGQDNSANPDTSFNEYANLGADLSGVTRQQNYDMRVTLTPSSTGDSSPIIRRMGVQETDGEIVDGLVNFGSATWAVDPITMQAEIPSIEVDLLRNGNRDYRSFVEDLFSTYHVGELHLRIWIGAPDLAKQYWLHVDDFIIDDYETVGASVKLYCISPLVLVNRDIPVVAGSVQTPLVYTANTPKAVYDDLIVSQIGLAARYRGAGIEDTSVTIGKRIETKRQGLTELSRVAWIAGGAIISSQGRIKYQEFFGTTPPDAKTFAHFPQDEVKIVGMSPGLRTRVTTYRVSHGWDQSNNQGRGNFAGLKSSNHAAATTNLGRALVDITEEADDEISQWIDTAAHAQTLANRHTQHFATGMMLWRVRSNIPYPHLEPGDPVTVESDRFVARDPNTGNAIRGPVTANARVQACHDIEGREFTLWVQDYADIAATATTVTNTGYEVGAQFTGLEIGFEDDGFVQLSWQATEQFQRGYGRITIANTPSNPTNPTSSSKDFTLETTHGSIKLEAAHANVTADHIAQEGQLVWVELIAENTDSDITQEGGGDKLFTIKRRRGDTEFTEPSFRITATRVGTTITVTIAGKDLSESMTAWDFSYSYPDGAGGTSTATNSTSWTTNTWSAGARLWTSTKQFTVSAGVTGQCSFRATYLDALGASRTKGHTITLENIDEVSKTLTIAAADLLPQDESESWSVGAAMYPGTSANTLNCVGAVVLPPGAEITSFQTQGARENAGDSCVVKLVYGGFSGSSPPLVIANVLATNTHGTSSSWTAVLSSALAHTVAAGTPYYLDVAVYDASGAITTAFAWAKILYDAPSYDVTI